jgi:hypothetical protein
VRPAEAERQPEAEKSSVPKPATVEPAVDVGLRIARPFGVAVSPVCAAV